MQQTRRRDLIVLFRDGNTQRLDELGLDIGEQIGETKRARKRVGELVLGYELERH